MKSIRTTLTPLILGALLASSASAQAGDGNNRSQEGRPEKENHTPEQILALFDKNGDGMLDDRECAAARKAIMERRNPGATGQGEDDGARRPSDQTRREAARSDSQARSDKARSDKARSDKARSDKARRDKARSDKARGNKLRSEKLRRDNFRRDQVRRKGASQNRPSRDRAGRAPSRRAPARQRMNHRGSQPGPKVNRQRGRSQKSRSRR